MTDIADQPSTKTLAIRGVLFNWIGRGCSFVITFFLTPFLLHTLGDARYGVWSIIMGLTSYYGLADAGLRGAGTKHIAEAHALGDHDRIQRIIVTSFAMYIGLSLTVLIVASVIALLYPYLFETGPVSLTTIQYVILLVAANFGLRLMSQPFAATLAALTRFDLQNALSVSSQLLQAGLIVLALSFADGLLAMAWAMLAVGVVGAIGHFWMAQVALGGFSMSPRHFDRQTLDEQFSFGSGLLAIGSMERIAEASGPLIVGAFAGPAAAGYYSIANQLTQKTERLTRGISTVLMPVSSRLTAEKRNNDLKKIVLFVPRCMFAVSMLSTVIFVFLGAPFLRTWLGAEYVETVYPLLCVLTIAGSLLKVSGGVASLLTGMGLLRFQAIVRAVRLVLTIGGGLLLTPFFGGLGMAWAQLAGFGFTGISQAWFIARHLELPISAQLQSTCVRGGGSLIPAAILAILLPRVWAPTTLPVVMTQIVAVAVVAAGGLLLICIPVDHRRSIIAALMPKPRQRKTPQPVTR
ncbi:colanic acid exporter [Maioricimonas rarisocia]|uniref:Colanic acid exporter n=1 Tax=Maioricimonas rarisocia TaxID=2528026 RepID=A0A517Z101_9PLAN|nr:oligosaccharide flippase family protein [Maioricimonas rarisocia]QDU36099.1 colanic acid exporter [Maioricimonas rarisocia]